MSAHVHVDMAEIEAALARAREAMAPIARENTTRGAQARMSLVIDHGFGRQIAEEINRGTEADLISDALAAVCSNMTFTMVDTFLPENPDPFERRFMVMRQMQKLANFIDQRFGDRAETVSTNTVRTMKGGQA